jgi:hypothetical protein
VPESALRRLGRGGHHEAVASAEPAEHHGYSFPFVPVATHMFPPCTASTRQRLVISSRSELLGEPVVEHGAREADVSPHPVAWQATGSYGLVDPAGLDVEIPGGLLGA